MIYSTLADFIMKNIRRFTRLIILALSLAGHSALCGEFEQGVKAFDAGDYASARKLLLPLAEHHGYTKAMNILGKMAELGLGGKVNGPEAKKWYEKAALLGSKDDMYNLGVLYGEGEAIERDYIKSVAWLGAAYDHRQKKALQPAKLISTKLNEKELAEASRLRKEINARLYGGDIKPETIALKAPPKEAARLLDAAQLIEAYSGKSSTFNFRDSVVLEHYRRHGDLKSALAGKKAKFEGEYRDGYYSGKWWVENDMLCLDYAKLEVFDDCFWIEKLDDKKFKSYQQKTGGTNIETVK